MLVLPRDIVSGRSDNSLAYQFPVLWYTEKRKISFQAVIAGTSGIGMGSSARHTRETVIVISFYVVEFGFRQGYLRLT
jgi:hypothetical protein